VITEALKLHDYNIARAATALGLGSRQTLYKKLKRLAINVGDFLRTTASPDCNCAHKRLTRDRERDGTADEDRCLRVEGK
jgi:hypothetical protein